MSSEDVMPRLPLYEQLATEIARQVDRGTFRPGEKIPSVRQTSQQRSLSVSTVLQAYRMLEDRRVIEARPQSGYYVLSRPVALTHEPEPYVIADPTTVDMGDLIMMVLRDTLDPTLTQFGAAIPDPSLLPTERLNRILAAVAHEEGSRQQYVCGAPEGIERLRVQVAQRAFLAGCNLSPDDILITSGCTEALSLALHAVCQPGDLVAIESPTYFGVLHILQTHGLQALELPTHPQTGMSLDALRFALDHYRISACLAMTSFENPLGSTMPEENKHELVRMLAERDIPLIEDDIHGELYFGRQRHHLAKTYDRKGLVIACSSFSKDLSPSYRVGWCAPGRFRTRIARLKTATNLSTAYLPQAAIAQFMESGGYDRHLRRIRRAYAAKVAAMSEAICQFFPEGTRIAAPDGGFLLWIELPERVDSLKLYRRALQAGITLAPGCAFSTTQKYHNYIRLNAAYMCDENTYALRRLADLVAE